MFGNSTYAIALLLEKEGPLPFSEIVKRVPFTEATVAKRLKQLKRAGFIKEEPHIYPDGRPSKKYTLTELGKEYVRKMSWAILKFYGSEIIRVENGKIVIDKEKLHNV